MPTAGGYRLNKRMLLRICLAEGKSVTEVGREVTKKTNKMVWQRLYNEGKPQDERAFIIIGRFLNREPSCFMELEPIQVQLGSPADQFARRVEDLIYSGELPFTYIDPIDKQERPVDIVAYLWAMGDKILANLPITYSQQLEAFELLKHWDLLEEFPIEKRYGQRPLIGPMRIVRPEKEALLQTLIDREIIEINEINFLENHQQHLSRVQQRYVERLAKFSSLAPGNIPGNVFAVDENDAINADWDCRRALVVVGSAELTLFAGYRPTRFAIATFKRRLQDEEQRSSHFKYSPWWKQCFHENYDELLEIGKALGKSGEKADFNRLRSLVEANCTRTKRMINQLSEDYPDEVCPDEQLFR